MEMFYKIFPASDRIKTKYRQQHRPCNQYYGLYHIGIDGRRQSPYNCISTRHQSHSYNNPHHIYLGKNNFQNQSPCIQSSSGIQKHIADNSDERKILP